MKALKHLLGSSGVALLFLGCFSLVVLSQARDRMKPPGRRPRDLAEAPPPAFGFVPGPPMTDGLPFPAMAPMGPNRGGRFGWKRLLDSDNDGEITLEEIDELTLNLKALDVDQNGTLTDDELPPNMSWHGGSPPFDAEAEFAPQIAAAEEE
jgi:hypothetical protein